jgi:DNA-binding SARP family transcriptional activator/tetratricopeptide (TPR) repeat protein
VPDVRFGLLGPLTVLDDAGASVELGGRQPRLVLAALLVADGRAVSVEALIDAVWGERPPATATGTLQSYVSRLRRVLGAERLVWEDAGYRLDVDGGDVDFRRFESLAEAGRARLDAGDPRAARELLLEADALWRGPALGDFADREFAAGIAARLEQRRLAAVEDRVDADLRIGRHAAVVGELTELVAAHPLRERLQAQLALALYRADRQADALRVIADAGRVLREELGIEPGPSLRALESAILDQDPALGQAPAPPGDPSTDTDPRSNVEAAVRSAGGIANGPRPASSGVALVGRTSELAELVEALDEAGADARFVVIEGEPGIGKTRLADELRTVATEQGSIALWGRSDEGGAAPALWPWLAPLRALAGAAPDVGASLQELLTGDAPMAAGQADSTQFERFEEVAALLSSSGATRPVVVLLDDLQWADVTSLELVAFLAATLERGVLIVATIRPLEVGRNDAVTDALAAIARRRGSRRLVLRGLTAAATAELLDAASGRTVGLEEVTAIHTRAEGNPFYAVELVRLQDEQGEPAAHVPGTVGDVIRRRLANLPTGTTDLLVLAAVVGRDVAIPVLARAGDRPLDEVLDELEPAIVHRLLVDVPERPGQLRFSHALVREVLLDDITSLRRARLHLRVADAIEATGAGVDDEEILAEHLWQAAPVGVGKRAADALQRAAEVAIRRVSYGAAEDLLGRAVQLRRATGSSIEDDEAELLAIYRLLEVARARRYFQGVTDPELVQRARQLAERCGRRDLMLMIVWFESAALATACRGAEHAALAEIYRALTEADPDPHVRALGLETMGITRWNAGDITGAVEQLDLAMALLAEAAPPHDGFTAEQRLVTETFWIWNHVVHGDLDPDDAFDRFDAMVASAGERFAVASICGFAVTTAIAIGAWGPAERYVATAREADPASQFAFWAGQILMCQGVILAREGRVDEALASFADGRDRYVAIGGRSALPTYGAVFGSCLAELGQLDEARRRIAEARRELDSNHERWNEPHVLIGEAVVAHASGDVDRARERFDAAAVVATAQGAHTTARLARDVAVGRSLGD